MCRVEYGFTRNKGGEREDEKRKKGLVPTMLAKAHTTSHCVQSTASLK
jgi:hypothetical protein